MDLDSTVIEPRPKEYFQNGSAQLPNTLSDRVSNGVTDKVTKERIKELDIKSITFVNALTPYPLDLSEVLIEGQTSPFEPHTFFLEYPSTIRKNTKLYAYVDIYGGLVAYSNTLWRYENGEWVRILGIPTFDDLHSEITKDMERQGCKTMSIAHGGFSTGLESYNVSTCGKPA